MVVQWKLLGLDRTSLGVRQNLLKGSIVAFWGRLQISGYRSKTLSREEQGCWAWTSMTLRVCQENIIMIQPELGLFLVL